MKKFFMVMALVCMMISTAALADGPVLFVELPEDALMIEDVQFDDGDFIQTYQLSDGARVQMLRYAAFDMTLEDLAEGEWTGYTQEQAMDIAQVSGCPASGLMLKYKDEAGMSLTVYLIMVEAEAQKLLMTAAFPDSLGEEQIASAVEVWLNTMTVSGIEDGEVG